MHARNGEEGLWYCHVMLITLTTLKIITVAENCVLYKSGTGEVSNAGWFMMKLVVPKVDAWKVKLGVHYMVPTLFMYVFVGRLCKG